MRPKKVRLTLGTGGLTMANEKRLIDANALIAEYDRLHVGEPGKARKLMADAPTVDAVEVVRKPVKG